MAVNCSGRCSCTGWRGCRCPTTTTATLSRFSDVDRRLCSAIPVVGKENEGVREGMLLAVANIRSNDRFASD